MCTSTVLRIVYCVLIIEQCNVRAAAADVRTADGAADELADGDGRRRARRLAAGLPASAAGREHSADAPVAPVRLRGRQLDCHRRRHAAGRSGRRRGAPVLYAADESARLAERPALLEQQVARADADDAERARHDVDGRGARLVAVADRHAGTRRRQHAAHGLHAAADEPVGRAAAAAAATTTTTTNAASTAAAAAAAAATAAAATTTTTAAPALDARLDAEHARGAQPVAAQFGHQLERLDTEPRAPAAAARGDGHDGRRDARLAGAPPDAGAHVAAERQPAAAAAQRLPDDAYVDAAAELHPLPLESAAAGSPQRDAHVARVRRERRRERQPADAHRLESSALPERRAADAAVPATTAAHTARDAKRRRIRSAALQRCALQRGRLRRRRRRQVTWKSLRYTLLSSVSVRLSSSSDSDVLFFCTIVFECIADTHV